MDTPTSPPTHNTQHNESHSLPHLVLNLGPPATPTLSRPSNCYESVLRPSIQSNLPKLRVSLLICDPSLPSLGMQMAIAWCQEQLLATWQWMDERNQARHAAGMIPVTQTMSQIIDIALDAMGPWSIATDTTPPIQSRYQHRSHPYLSDPQPHHSIEKWPELVLCTRTLPHWQLKLPNSLTKMTKIPSKYQHHLSSQRMKGLPKGWAYVKDNEEGKQGELRDLNWYGHLPPWLIHTQRHHEQWLLLNRPRDSSTMSGKTSFPSPSPMNMEFQPQPDSSKST